MTKVPVATSSTLAISWGDDSNEVVPPLLSVDTAVTLINLSTYDWSDGIVNSLLFPPSLLSILLKLELSSPNCHWNVNVNGVLVSSRSIIPLVLAVKIPPSCTSPSITKVPLATSSTLEIIWGNDSNEVFPPLLSVDIAVNLINLSTYDWSDGIVNVLFVAPLILLLVSKLELSSANCHWNVKVNEPSSSKISLVLAVNVEPSCTVPSKDKIPVASSSTLAICCDADWNSVVPPKLSVETAVNLIYLST